MSGFTSSTSSSRMLQDIVDQLRRDAEKTEDTLERIQQQLALLNDGENLAPMERHYGQS